MSPSSRGRRPSARPIDQGLTILQTPDPYRNATIRLWDPFVRPANVQQWSLILEQQLASETVLSAGYIGQHGTHLIVPMPYFQRILLPDRTTVPGPYLSGNPQLANIAQISGTEANGNQRYDALQISCTPAQGRRPGVSALVHLLQGYERRHWILRRRRPGRLPTSRRTSRTRTTGGRSGDQPTSTPPTC